MPVFKTETTKKKTNTTRCALGTYLGGEQHGPSRRVVGVLKTPPRGEDANNEKRMIRYIPLCGAPGSGKTETARILERDWGFRPIDDSWILRDAAKTLYGLTDWHVSTQEGKATKVQVGTEWILVRVLLGELGLFLEQRDPHHIPKRALEEAIAAHPDARLCFGSVRRDQARVFKDTGQALVVEVCRPGFEPVNSFDHYDRSLVDVSITNTYDPADPIGSSARLAEQIARLVAPRLG